ncbi:hypothetical protein J19TS2_08770 [Cohnella xylanilytica]|uniref:LuxR family transcriptional regulator n=1 Tax=Cohnella xylanilytica TaxID=557555 RepID=UPI001B1D5483|nr:LuxR family transcriptional regulator [Cohnella xylanilytica]GIO11322.1 hypothetical protein J19TS2_08770 [Cohnella xylanilytica]
MIGHLSFADLERHYIVGRDEELGRFRSLLSGGGWPGQASFLHVHGTGGVGKSTYLRLCRREAERAGACFILLDSPDFVHTKRGFAEALLQLLEERLPTLEGLSDCLLERCLGAVGRLSQSGRVVLAFDTFEKMQDLETWLRERFLAALPEGTIVLTAGRRPLKGAWQLSPVWRRKLAQFELAHLDQADCHRYLTRCGSYDEGINERIWRLTKGHPLTLSLAAAAHVYDKQGSFSKDADWFEETAALWLREVPDPQLRTVVETASVLRHFDQELLSFLLEEEVPGDVFDRLTALSFVSKSKRGWQLHDLMRETTSARLRARVPKHYKRLCERAAGYYADAVLESASRSDSGWEVRELFRYVGPDVLRALSSETARSSLYWETLTKTTLGDAIAYIERRRNWTEDGQSGMGVDPETGAAFRIEYSAEAIRGNVTRLDARQVYELDPEAIKLLRDQEGQARGLAVVIPFHEGTIPFMEEDPICSPYLKSLKPEEKRKLLAPRYRPAGWFIRVLDCWDVLDPDVRDETIDFIFSYICSGGLVVCSPYPTEIARKTYPGFGFCTIESAAHRNHEGSKEAPTYALDTRGDKLRGFLEAMLRRAGLDWRPSTRRDSPKERSLERQAEVLSPLTKRELEVAELVLAGLSNGEVARKLFVSEATVKKHLRAVYDKLGVRTRVQLARVLIQE